MGNETPMALIFGSDTCRIWKGPFGKVYAEVIAPHPSGDPWLLSWVPWTYSPHAEASWDLSKHLGLSEHPGSSTEREIYWLQGPPTARPWGAPNYKLFEYWVYMRYALPGSWMKDLHWGSAWAKIRYRDPWGWQATAMEPTKVTEFMWQALLVAIAEGVKPLKEVQGEFMEINSGYRSTFPPQIASKNPEDVPLTMATLLNLAKGSK